MKRGKGWSGSPRHTERTEGLQSNGNETPRRGGGWLGKNVRPEIDAQVQAGSGSGRAKGKPGTPYTQE